jgi:GntR family transcriptional regulator
MQTSIGQVSAEQATGPSAAGRIRYRQIAEDLRRRIGVGEFVAGRVLPSEAELGGAYAASRVTIRKALDRLREDGLVEPRQGLGWLVAADPLRQSLARLGTIESQLAASGAVSERRVLNFGYVDAPPGVGPVLGAERVLEVRRLNLADAQPFARVTVWCPDHLAKGLSLDDVERAPFYELLDVPLGSATQTIGARACAPADAAVLEIPAGSPVLVCNRVTRDGAGTPVLVSEHVFPAHRTEFVVELSTADRSMAPSGLRLVD